jgi:hypothetical protein
MNHMNATHKFKNYRTLRVLGRAENVIIGVRVEWH